MSNDNTYIAPKGFPHSVFGTEFLYHSMSVKVVAKTRNLAKPIAMALSVIFDDRSKDTGHSSFGTDGGEFQNKGEAIDPILAAQRSADRSRAIGQVVEALSDEKNLEVLGLLVLDSLREPGSKPIAMSAVDPWLEDQKLPCLIQHLIGMAKANKDVFGDLGERMASRINGVLKVPAEEALAEALSGDAPSEEPSSDQEEAGKPSKTPSPE